MLKTFFTKLRLISKDSILRRRILFVLGALIVFRILAVIPIPGVNEAELARFFADNQFLGLLNLFSGGGLSGLSIVMLGVGPYITASIIMQLGTMMSEKLKNLYHEEGEAGKRKFSQYTRLLSVPLAVIQGIGFLLLLQSQNIIPDLAGLALFTNIIVITAGSVFLMWIGEMMSEFGIGNGVSLIIFAGIVAGFPNAIGQFKYTFDPAQIPAYIAFLVVAVVIIIGVVVITEAERPVPVTYAKQVRGTKTYGGTSTYLPLKINQAGVIPIIFALSLLLIPQMAVNFLGLIDSPTIQAVVTWVSTLIANQWFYGIAYFVLVFLFTYFYTAVTFDPESIAKNLQKGGAFIPGVRPGEATSKYLGTVLTRITFVGALFLGLIAVLPIIVQGVSGITTFTIGGTALLIAVSVIIDLVKKTEAQISMREY